MSKNIGRNIYQKMSNTIRNLKKENEDLKKKLNDFLENFDETIRKKYNVEANKKIIHLEVEKLELKHQLEEKNEERPLHFKFIFLFSDLKTYKKQQTFL